MYVYIYIYTYIGILYYINYVIGGRRRRCVARRRLRAARRACRRRRHGCEPRGLALAGEAHPVRVHDAAAGLHGAGARGRCREAAAQRKRQGR